MKRFAILALLVGFAALPLFAQTNPTGNLTGHVTDGVNALPGAAVTVWSPNLQGTRTAVTTTNGDFILSFLPPGEYRVRFELQGFQSLETSIKISAAQSSKLDAEMPAAKVAEEVTVTGSYETISASSQASTTYEASLLSKLPLPRDLTAYVSITPGVTTGVNGYQIAGAMSYQNLYLVNGVVVNENIRGQSTPLYIEDAIQETTITTANVSAEFGRFAGGVVNTLTKSGGNEVHGSIRDSLDKGTWRAPTPLTVSRADVINQTYEGTLGGYVFKDHLWYFGAGRHIKTTGKDQTALTAISFPTSLLDQRYELKMTGAITPEHRIVGSYINRAREWENYYFTPIPALDLNVLYPRQIPETLAAVNYTGVLTDNFFIEGQYSKRTLIFQNSGSVYQDLLKGTVIFSNNFYDYHYNSAIFCGVCGPERRDNNDYIAKGSWFLSTSSLGSHDIVFGYDRFTDIRKSNNYQSGTNFNLLAEETLIGPTQGTTPALYPIMTNTLSYIEYYPIFNFSKGTDFKTESIFVNDKWRLNNNWSFNVGLRWDKNNGKDAEGKLVAKDSKISPRLGVTFDPKGNGDWLFNAGYGKYVTSIANGVGDSTSSAGSPAYFEYLYGGPEINVNCNPDTGAGCTNPHDTITQVFNWFYSVGGHDPLSVTDPNILVYVDIPGAGTQIRGSLDSVSADEASIGLTKRLGARGVVRLDYLNRQFHDFYVTRIDASTGPVTAGSSEVDLKLLENNDNVVERSYDALMVQFGYRPGDRWNVGGNYTWSKLKGNIVGETTGSGAISTGVLEYPEYKAFAQYNPTGLLSSDATHRARLWVVWDAIATKHNRLSISLMQNFTSGTPYGAFASIPIRAYVSGHPFDYLTPPSTVNYWFTARDKWRSPNITTTDISVPYSFRFPAIGKEFEIFVVPAVTNVLNEDNLVNFNTTVYATTASRGLSGFNPFTETPKECPAIGTTCATAGSNWMRGPLWGQARAPSDYQTPRTFSLTLGIRF